MWTAYPEDLMDVDPSYPAQEPQFVGTAFQQQTMRGPTFNDPGDDRVSFIGDAYDPTVMHMRSLSLPADLDSDGYGASHGGIVFPGGPQIQPSTITPDGNVPNSPAVLGGEVVQSDGGDWYDTLRPNAGWPVSLMGDEQYAAVTGDTIAHEFGVVDPLTVTPGTYTVPEKPLQTVVTEFNNGSTQTRLSKEPSTEQAPYRLWGSALGEWIWGGRKDALNRPIADSGPWFSEPLYDGIPSPTGAGGAMQSSYSYDLYPEPMTFRAPPTPWDQGPNSDNGYYINGGGS
jgi:hypothetical protein